MSLPSAPPMEYDWPYVEVLDERPELAYAELKNLRRTSRRALARLINRYFVPQIMDAAIARSYVSALKGRHLEREQIHDDDVRQIQKLFSQNCPAVYICSADARFMGSYHEAAGRILISAAYVDGLIADSEQRSPAHYSAALVLFAVFVHELGHFVRHCGCSSPPQPDPAVRPRGHRTRRADVWVPAAYAAADMLAVRNWLDCAGDAREAGYYCEQEIFGGIVAGGGERLVLETRSRNLAIPPAVARRALDRVPFVPLGAPGGLALSCAYAQSRLPASLAPPSSCTKRKSSSQLDSDSARQQNTSRGNPPQKKRRRE